MNRPKEMAHKERKGKRKRKGRERGTKIGYGSTSVERPSYQISRYDGRSLWFGKLKGKFIFSFGKIWYNRSKKPPVVNLHSRFYDDCRSMVLPDLIFYDNFYLYK